MGKQQSRRSRGYLTLIMIAALVASVVPVSVAAGGMPSVAVPGAAIKAAKTSAMISSPGASSSLKSGALVPLDADDTIAGATPLSPSPVVGSLSTVDDPTDVYSVTLAAGQRLRVVISGAATLNADAYLYQPYVTDANVSNAIAGTLGDAFPKMFSYDVPAGGGGVYHVAIDAASGSGTYTVTWQILPVPFGPDDDIPGVVPVSSLVDRDLDYLTDVDDVYAIAIGEGQRLQASLVADVGTDFDVYLYDKGATGLGDDLPIGGSSNPGSAESFVFEAPPGGAGTYFVDVHCVSGVGAYTLAWSVTGVPAGAFETAAVAMVVPTGNGSRAGALDRLTNANTFYKWTLSAEQRFEATLTAGAGTDFDIYLYGPDGVTPLAWSNGSSYPEHVMWDVSATGTYYIEVVSFTGNGTYSIEYSTVATPVWVGTTRSAGADRYSTAISLSEGAFAAGSVTTAVVATGQDFPDALSAAGLAGVYHAPVLLTKTASLPTGLVSELDRLGAQNVVIVGGEPAVSPSVAGSLVNAGFSVSRVSGSNRYATSAAVADRIAALTGPAFGKMAFVARGDMFPDALALAPFAYSQSCPVLLTKTSSLSPECSAVIGRLGVREVYIAGSTAAVSGVVESSLNALPGVTMQVSRLAGANRYETAAVIATRGLDFWWGDAGYVGIATGTNFPDALGGGAVCGSHHGVMLLTDPKSLSAPAASFIAANASAIKRTEVFGAPVAVSEAVRLQVDALMTE